ncbi:MAG: DUF58 domain-containing protein [Halobacteriales archaeon]|nr:DUF58 domain-containing protein [Halobacteriales archaeon]
MTITTQFLTALDRFTTSQKRQVSSIFQGEQSSETVGEGLIFSDYRRYTPGDEPRLIDWKLYARTEELYIKQFEEERNLTVHVLVDASGSMDFGDEDTNKFEYAAKLGLGFAYLTASEHNDFRFTVFDDTPERLDSGRSNRGEILGLIDRCNAIDPAGGANFADVLTEYAGTIDSRSLLLIVSDFLEDVSAIRTGVESLVDNQLILAHVLAPEERDLPADGDTVFRDLETDRTERTYFGRRLAESYRDRLLDHVDSIEELADELRIRHEAIDTGAPFFESFADVWIE